MNKLANIIRKHKFTFPAILAIILALIILLIIRQVSNQATTNDIASIVSDLHVVPSNIEFVPMDQLHTKARQIVSFFDNTLSVGHLYSANLECPITFTNTDQTQLELSGLCRPYDYNPLGGLSILWARSLAYIRFGDSLDAQFLLEDTAGYLNYLQQSQSAATNNFVCAYMQGIWENDSLSAEIRNNAREICLASSQASSIPTDDIATVTENEFYGVPTIRGLYNFLTDNNSLATSFKNVRDGHPRPLEVHHLGTYFPLPLAVYARRLAENSIKYGLNGDIDTRREAEFNFSLVLAKYLNDEIQEELSIGDICLMALALQAYSDNLQTPDGEEIIMRLSPPNLTQIANDDLISLGQCALAGTHSNIDRLLLSNIIANTHQTQRTNFSLDRNPYPFLSAITNQSESGHSWLIDTEVNGQLIGGMLLAR